MFCVGMTWPNFGGARATGEITMSLVKKPTMTPRKLAAVRRNARLTNVLIKVRNGALTQKDVKNAGRPG